MKRKITTFFLIIGIFMVAAAVTLLLIYMSPWAKEKSERSEGRSESGFILKANEDKGDFLIAEKKDCDFFEFCINCTELDGAIIFKVSYLYNMTENESTLNDKDASVIMQEEIERIGVYEYDFSDFKDGFYRFELSKMDNMTGAMGSIRLTTYDSNWSGLMKRLGFK